nr:dammarenediol II synthase-like [Ipomoea batatas]
MWKLKIGEGGGPYMYSTNNYVGRTCKIGEEREALENARQEFRKNREKGYRACGDLFKRMQMIKESGVDVLSLPAIRLKDEEEVNYEAVTTAVRKAVRLNRALQAKDGHWPAEHSGPMFFIPPLVLDVGALTGVWAFDRAGFWAWTKKEADGTVCNARLSGYSAVIGIKIVTRLAQNAVRGHEWFCGSWSVSLGSIIRSCVVGVAKEDEVMPGRAFGRQTEGWNRLYFGRDIYLCNRSSLADVPIMVTAFADEWDLPLLGKFAPISVRCGTRAWCSGAVTILYQNLSMLAADGARGVTMVFAPWYSSLTSLDVAAAYLAPPPLVNEQSLREKFMRRSPDTHLSRDQRLQILSTKSPMIYQHI